jgi:hypothetical protein
MSHFTNIKTNLNNLFYLEKSLERLKIKYKREKFKSGFLSHEKYYIDLLIEQSNGYDIKFCWTGKEYELVGDMTFWKQPYPIETFIDTVTQQYAGELIISEGQKTGFQPVKYQKNEDGSNTLVLQRWYEVSK